MKNYTSTLKKECKNCGKVITVRRSDHNRGQALFCSRACSGYHNNTKRKNLDLTCAICGGSFKSKCSHAKYCSTSCRRHMYVSRAKKDRDRGKYRYHLSKKIRDKYGALSCFICGWQESTCDVHHIVPRSKGGTDEDSNMTVVCPNHHRMIHQGKVNVNNIKTLAHQFKLKK